MRRACCLLLTLLVGAACGEISKRQKLPPSAEAKEPQAPAATTAAVPVASPPPSASVKEPFEKVFAIGDLRRAACLTGEDGSTVLKAENCGSGSVLFGPYTQVPEGSRISATFELQGVKGTNYLSVDMIGGGGARLYASASTFELRAGEKRKIELGSEARAGEESLEARLWNRADPGTSFSIVDARVEIRRQ